jgi:hypothetical protein
MTTRHRRAARARRPNTLSALTAIRVTIGAVTLGLAAPLIHAPSARADVSFTGHAEAHGFRFTATNPALPLGFVFEGDAPIATADLSSFGDSQALAAGPYPGTTAAATPGTVGGLIGVPVPAYPVVATATAGDAPSEQNLPGLTLRADAAATRSEGRALMGTGGQGASAEAAVDATRRDSAGVTAEATARAEGLGVLDYLHLQRVQSTASTTLDSTGHRVSSSDLRIDGITAPGLTFTVPAQTAGQVPLPNPAPGLPQPPPLVFTPVPFPGAGSTLSAPELGFRNGEFVVAVTSAGVTQRYPVPFTTVADAFKAIGWRVAFQPESRTDDGIVGATLTFSTDLPAPPANPFGVDRATPVTLELGRASTSMTGRAFGADLATGVVASGSSPGVTSGAAPGLPGTLPDLGAVPGTLPATSDGAVPGLASGDGQVALTTGPGGPGGSSPFTDLYAVFVVVAAVVLLAAPLASRLGSRPR